MIVKIVKRASHIDDTYVYQVEIEWSDLDCFWQVYKDVVDKVYVNGKPLDSEIKNAIYESHEVVKKDNALYIRVGGVVWVSLTLS
jgi:hypothetical protein